MVAFVPYTGNCTPSAVLVGFRWLGGAASRATCGGQAVKDRIVAWAMDQEFVEVREIFGSASMSDAVNAALAEVINAEGRPKEAFDRSEVHDLDEPEILRGEWRYGKPPV